MSPGLRCLARFQLCKHLSNQIARHLLGILKPMKSRVIPTPNSQQVSRRGISHVDGDGLQIHDQVPAPYVCVGDDGVDLSALACRGGQGAFRCDALRHQGSLQVGVHDGRIAVLRNQGGSCDRFGGRALRERDVLGSGAAGHQGAEHNGGRKKQAGHGWN
jgi:hypothetical protein